MVAGKDHDGHAGIGQQPPGAVDHRRRDAVVVERVAGEQHDIGLAVACAGQHGGQAGGAVAVMGVGDAVVIDMQVGTVDQDDVHGGRLMWGHGCVS